MSILVLAALLAGCADVELGGPAAAPDVRTAMSMADGQYHCAGCHYGLAPVWDAEWESVGNDTWDLLVRSIWPNITIDTVDVIAGNQTPLAYRSGFIAEEWAPGWMHASGAMSHASMAGSSGTGLRTKTGPTGSTTSSA